MYGTLASQQADDGLVPEVNMSIITVRYTRGGWTQGTGEKDIYFRDGQNTFFKAVLTS